MPESFQCFDIPYVVEGPKPITSALRFSFHYFAPHMDINRHEKEGDPLGRFEFSLSKQRFARHFAVFLRHAGIRIPVSLRQTA